MHNVLRFVGKYSTNIFLFLFSLSAVSPIVWLIYSSLKTQQSFLLDIISLPTTFHFDNYVKAISIGHMDTYFFNSVYVSVISVILIIFIAFLTAYVLARFKFRGRTLIYIMFLSGMLIPIHGLLVPIFVEFKSLGLLDERFTLILPYVTFELPIAIFLLESFIKNLPVEIEEAAYIDGCSTTKMLFRIVLPMCKPVMAAVVILSFLNVWNEFPFALVLINTPALRTLPIGLANFASAHTSNYPQMMAAMVISVIPILALYLGFYRRIISGMTAGAVKQ